MKLDIQVHSAFNRGKYTSFSLFLSVSLANDMSFGKTTDVIKSKETALKMNFDLFHIYSQTC